MPELAAMAMPEVVPARVVKGGPVMEGAVTPGCDYCEEEDDLFQLPLLLQVGDRVLLMVCRPCYTYLSGAEPRHRPALALGESDA
jgi:hypothetical protein